MKLVVTGHDAGGKAVFSYAGEPPGARGTHDLWATRGPVAVPDASDPLRPAQIGYFPEVGETSFKVVTVPGREPGAGPTRLPEDIAHLFDADDPEMHTTDTLDYVLILGGQAELELDDGAKETVRAGDAVVQRGTRHAWRVVGDEPLVLAAVLIGAERRGG